MEDVTRNKNICIDFLNGGTYRTVGSRYGVSAARVAQILHKYMRRATYGNPLALNYYEAAQKAQGATDLRKHKDLFIPLIEAR
jgi:hypothetical protein